MKRSRDKCGLKKLRLKVERLYREHVALYVFFHAVSANEWLRVKDTVKQIRESSEGRLRTIRTQLKAANLQISRHYGLRVPVSEIVKVTEGAENAQAGVELLIPKAYVRTVCSRYDRSLPGFESLPEHAYIG